MMICGILRRQRVAWSDTHDRSNSLRRFAAARQPLAGEVGVSVELRISRFSVTNLWSTYNFDQGVNLRRTTHWQVVVSEGDGLEVF